MKNSTYKIFVYGTLLKNEYNHHYLEDGTFLYEAETIHDFTLFDLKSYPALASSGSTAVKGEAYLVDDNTLSSIDLLEGHPNYYTRKKIKLSTGELMETYIINSDELERLDKIKIVEGDWKKYKEDNF